MPHEKSKASEKLLAARPAPPEQPALDSTVRASSIREAWGAPAKIAVTPHANSTRALVLVSLAPPGPGLLACSAGFVSPQEVPPFEASSLNGLYGLCPPLSPAVEMDHF